MELGKIRSVSYKIFDNDGNPRDMVFQLGSKHNVGFEDEKKQMPIRKYVSDIVLEDERVLVYLSDGQDAQIWKNIAYNKFCTLEYEND
jgi:hypothetical protein